MPNLYPLQSCVNKCLISYNQRECQFFIIQHLPAKRQSKTDPDVFLQKETETERQLEMVQWTITEREMEMWRLRIASLMALFVFTVRLLPFIHRPSPSSIFLSFFLSFFLSSFLSEFFSFFLFFSFSFFFFSKKF